ncbi:Alstrom syndrome protein 1 isoform X2 [Sturnira hondurensis]|uniref:Alstrom syndrome protein 1 isoform X2 n=1 Tax=Sturnira hondurensis TaxID=192404 RepID=UPI00187AB841|nr:Alstrom syndrome protein 1 isoform X2 [Sturnira hondurensis]
MEPEDLPWPGELEDEEVEEEAGEEEEEVVVQEEKEEVEKPENLDDDEVITVEDEEVEERRELDADFNYESQPRESTDDDEEDEEAKAWLQAHPGGTLPPSSLPKHRYSESEPTSPEKVVPLTSHVWQQSSYQDKNRRPISDSNVVSLEETAQWDSEDDQKTESWHFLPQEIDSSYTSDTTQTRFKVREEGTEMTDFPSVEEVIQDSFASPDLPLLTCLTQDQEFGLDPLFHQSELDFVPLRVIPGKSEDTEWFSRPSEVSEALFQAASEVASDVVSSHFSVSQHSLTGSTALESQGSFLYPEQGTKEETVSSGAVDELKTPKDSDSYDALCSYMWKTQEEFTQEPETTLANQDQLSTSTSSDTSEEEYVTPKERDSFDVSCLYVQYGKQEALQQSEKHLTSKDHDSCSDSSDTIDKNKISEGIGNFSAPLSCMPWSEQGASHHPETCAVSKDHVSFPHEVASHCNNKMSYSVLHCLLERRGKSVPLMSDSHYCERVYLRAPAENEVKQKMVSLEGYERNEEGLGKELPQSFELKESSSTLVFLKLCPSSSEVQYIENVVVPDDSFKVSETHTFSREHGISKVETSGGPLQTITSTLDETSEQLYFQEERNQKASAAFGGKNVNATENVAFEAVIASIEPSKKENTGNEIQTDFTKSLTNYSQGSEPKNSGLFLFNYSDANSFFDKSSHPHCQSTPGVFEPAASKPLLHKNDDGISSLFWHTNAKLLPGAPQEMFIRPLSSAPLSEKSHSQVVGLCKTQSRLFQCGVDNEPFLPIAEKAGSSNIIYPLKVSTSDPLFLQDLKQQTFEEVADSSNYILGKNVNSSHIIERPSAAVGSSFSANLVAYDAESQGALPMTNDASLIAVGQETLLKADTGLGEIPRPMGAKSSFTVHTIIQNDSYFVEGLQGKSESDISTLADDTECCSLDENAVVCSKRSTELQREMCDQGDLSGECIEVACLENLLDDLEICDSSLPWQSTLQQPSKEESSFGEPVGHSDMDISQSFASVLPPFVPHEPNSDLEYHSSDLRMLRVSPEIVPKTLKRLSGDISKGSITEITQSNLKAGITTTSGDSDTGSYLPLTPEDFPQLVVRSSVENTLHLHTDSRNKQILADGHVTEEALKVLAVPELADQKTGISTLPSSSYSLREKPNIFYPQPLRGNLTEGPLTVSAVPGPTDQKTNLSTVPPSTYLLGEKPSIFYQQTLPDSDQTEEAPKVSAVLGPVDQKSEKTTVPSSSFSHRERQQIIFSQQQLPDSHLIEQALKVSATAERADQVTMIPTLSSTLYSHAEKPHIFFPQTLPGNHLPEQARKVSAAPGSTEQKTGIPTVPSTSYSHRETPSLFYQQKLPESHLPEQSQQTAAVSIFADQKTEIPTGTSTFSHGETPLIFQQQTLPGSHLPEQALKVSASPGSTEQNTEIPTVSSTSYSHRETPSLFYQQKLPESHLPEQSQQTAAVSIFADQKTGIPTGTSTFSHGETPLIFQQQTLPGSHLPEQALTVSAAPGSTEQKTGIPTVSSTSYSHGETPLIFQQQTLPGSHVLEQALKVSAAPGLADQRSGIPTVSSTSHSHTEKPYIIYQQELPVSYLTKEGKEVLGVPGPAQQKTGVPVIPFTSHSHREKPFIFNTQGLPDSHLPEESLKVTAVPGLADQKAGLASEPSGFYSHREKPVVFYPQDLPDTHLTEEALKVPTISGPADQKTGIPTVPSTSYPHGEKHIFISPQTLPDSHLHKEALKVLTVSGPDDQKTGVPSEPSGSYSHREEPIIFYPQGLTESHLPEEALKVTAVPGPGDQKTGIPSVPTSAYSVWGKSINFYQQALPDRHITEETLNVSASPEPAEQKTELPTVSSTSYSQREKPLIFYPQDLPDSQLSEEALKISVVSLPGDQNTRKPTAIPTSYSHKEKPIISYQQELTGNHVTEEALKGSGVPGTADQNTGLPTVPSNSYSYREKQHISYKQDLTQEVLKVVGGSRLAGQKTGIPVVTSASYSHEEKPIISYQQELPDHNEDALKLLVVSGPPGQKTDKQIVSSSSYSHREGPISSYQKELPDITEETLEVSTVAGPTEQKTGIRIIPSGSYSYREKGGIFYQHELPDTTEETLKVFVLPVQTGQKNEISAGPSSSYSLKEKPKISTVVLPDDQKTELPTASSTSYSRGEKPENLTVIGPDDQKTPLLTVFHNSYSRGVKPSIFFKQHLPGEDNVKASPVPEPTDVNSGIPISSSYSNREKSNILSAQELPEKRLTEDVLKVSTILEPDNQKTALPTAPPRFFSYREKPNIFYQQDLPDRHLTEDSPKFSSGLGQTDENTGLSTGHSGIYSHSEKHKLVSDHVQRLIDNLDSSHSSIISNNMPLNSQADYRVVNKTEPSGFEDVSSEEIQYTDNSSKTLKQIQTLLMEAENIALKRCNFPAPLVPFRDVSDISFIQSKKVVCFKEPCTPDESNVDLPLRKPFIEENPSSKYIQKDINTETNLKCQRGIENWECINSTTVRSPIQEAESKARVALDETLRQYKAAKSVMRSEPEGSSGTFGDKILIPMMTIIKSDSSSDASSCSWDSNSLESVSDVLLNLLPYASPKTSMTDSREEECVSESDDGGGSSVDSLAAHVKNLLKCESSLNHAKQILRNAEEEECRVRARAWNLKFNMAHNCGYSISELNEDDRRKVEEIKAKLFCQDDLSKGLQSPRGIGCKPEAVCSHVIIESHEKGCFRTLSAKQPQLDSHPCVFRSAEPLEMIRRQRSPLSWRPRHINLSKSLDQSNPHFKVWNSLQLQSHSPFQNFTGDEFRISKDFQMPFREKMDPWLSELVEPNCLPPEEMDCHSSSQMLPPESMKKFTSITFSSHRHSKCFSDSSVLKVGVTEESPPRDLKQKTSSPSLLKIISHSPDKAVTILAESGGQGQKLSVEHSHQEEKLSENSDFKGSHSEPSASTNCSKFKEVHFSDNHTLISMGRPSSTLGVKEKNVTLTPNPPSHIFLEQQELFEQSKAPHADHCVKKHHSPPPQHQHYVVPNLPCHIFLEKRELLEQRKTPRVDHHKSEHHSPLPQGEDYIASDLPSSIFLEQRQLFEQSKAPDIDHHIKKQYSSLPQGQDCVEENSGQHKPTSHISNINVETKVNSVVSQSALNQCTLVISPPSTPSANRKALSCVRITISPKTSSNLGSGALDKKFFSLDPAYKTRMNSEFNPDLQTISSQSLRPTSKLLTSKPGPHDQESLGFLGPKSSPDFQVKQTFPDGNTVPKDLKTIPFQNSQIVTSRQTQVNFSDLEEYSSPEGTSVSADRSLEKIKPSSSAFSGKLSSDAVTQITTESPGKAMFSSEIFINSEDRGHEISTPSSQKLGKVPVRFASSSSVQQSTLPDGTNGAQPSLLPYKPSGSTKMYYVPQLSQIPSSLDSKSDTTIESSHSGSNDAIAPHFPAQVLGTRDDDLAFPVNIKHKEGIYSKRAVTKASSLVGQKPFQKNAQVQVLISEDENLSDKNKKKEIYNKKAVTKPAQSEEIGLQKDTTDSSDAVAAELSSQLQDTKIERLPDTKAIKQKEEIHSKRKLPKEAWTEDKESLQINIEESRCHSEFENTTHSVFRSAKFYFHHPVHLPSDQDFCHESLGGSVFMRHSWKDFFQHHPDKKHTCLPPSSQKEEKTKTRIESVSINVNLENKEVMHPTKSQARDYAKCDKQINDQKKDLQVTPEPTAQHITSLNELWNKYQERQKQQKPPGYSDRKEVSLVERLDRLAKLLQHPITHSLQPLQSTQGDSREQQDAKEWRGRQQQQKNKLQKKKRYKSLEKCYKNIGDLKKSKVLSTHQTGGSNQIKIEQVKFDKYILRKQPDFHYINSTSSDSRPSEDSELLTDTATNILSTTTSPVESDILTQTDKEMILHERSSSASTIDTARLIQAFGHERVCLSPRRIKLYSSITDHQRRYIEKRSKNKKKALSTSYPQMTSEHTRRKRIQVTNHMISSDSISSSTGSFWSSNSTLCNKQNVHMLNKGVQAGNLEIVNGVRKHTRDVGVTFPTPSSSEVRVEEDSDVTTWSEEKIEEKRLITSYLGDKKLKKNKQSCSEGVSWFVPVENVKSGPKKENLLKHHGPGISWFAPITNVKPWREPLREQNWQRQHTDSHGSLAGPGRGPLKPLVRATLQESLQLHRPDFISRSGERIKRLKLIVQERKLQNMFQSEREALFNTVREWQGHRDPARPLPKRGFLAAQKGRPIGKKEMIQRSKRIYEQLPEVQKKREEEKRRLEHKSYRLRAQLYKKKVTNQLLGRKVPWD